MICNTSIYQSFFLFYKNEKKFGSLTFAQNIFDWRINWTDEINPPSQDSKTKFNGIYNLSNKCGLISISEFFSDLIAYCPRNKSFNASIIFQYFIKY